MMMIFVFQTQNFVQESFAFDNKKKLTWEEEGSVHFVRKVSISSFREKKRLPEEEETMTECI